MSSVLSDAKILEGLEHGSIAIHPFRERNLSNSSYDVTLGENFFEPHPQNLDGMFCPWNPEHISKYWGSPAKAQIMENSEDAEKHGCLVGDKVIVICPGDTILAHTNEFIGGISGVTTMMKARSSMGRSAVSICKCAGWGDIGYVNRWTMEIQNSSQLPIVLVVGQRVGQIVFFKTDEATRSYETRGSYQISGDVGVLESQWVPEMMLPVIKRDDV